MHLLIGEVPLACWKWTVPARCISRRQLIKAIHYYSGERTQEGDYRIVTPHLE
jgi:hypothetical protein